MRLLIVEDDPDGREMLAELFRTNDWDVSAVPTTEAAMQELRAGGFDVIISDENLEGESGSCMLREASEEGLLQTVGALMYTAEPGKLQVPPGVRVLRKPLGITTLLDEAIAVVPELAEPVNARRMVELVLYVTSSSSSQRALETLQHVLHERHPSRVRVVVHDLEREPLGAVALEHAAAFTPVLVRRRPGRCEERFVGDLESPQSLARLIDQLEAPASSSSEATGARTKER